MNKEMNEIMEVMMKDEGKLDQLIQLFRSFGDGSRMKILFQIYDQEVSVQNIAQNLGMSEPAVSHHLRILKANGLVKWRRNGKEIYYQLDDDHVRELIHMGCEHVMEERV